MPCGGIYPMKADPELQCFHCNGANADHSVEEWDSFLHGRCIVPFLMTDEGAIVLEHGHEVVMRISEERALMISLVQLGND
jgi:hypothetical protein